MNGTSAMNEITNAGAAAGVAQLTWDVVAGIGIGFGSLAAGVLAVVWKIVRDMIDGGKKQAAESMITKINSDRGEEHSGKIDVLTAAVARMQAKMESSFEHVDGELKKVSNVERRLETWHADVTGQIRELADRQRSLDESRRDEIRVIGERFSEVGERFSKVEARIDKLEGK